MIKKIFTLCLCALSLNLFAVTANADCGQAPPTWFPSFCTTFKNIAQCHCQQSGGLPEQTCTDMTALYNAMNDMFGSMESACGFQTGTDGGTDQATCINDWNYYRSNC